LSDGAVQQHAIMDHANDFNRAVGRHAIHHKMPGTADTLLRRNEYTAQTQRINADAGDPRDRMGSSAHR
jgi:hypothetical protein